MPSSPPSGSTFQFPVGREGKRRKGRGEWEEQGGGIVGRRQEVKVGVGWMHGLIDGDGTKGRKRQWLLFGQRER